jgi:DNA-binding PadR family transcriptional regulator
MSVRYALLALLSQGPKCGVQLRDEFEARTGEAWPPDAAPVSTTLQRLERDGLAERDDSPAVPGDGLAVPGDGLAVPGDGLAEPDAGLAVPGAGLAEPGERLAVPGDRLAESGAGLAEPSDRLAGRGAGLAVPGDARADGPDKRYRITAGGERDLAGWLRAAPDSACPPHDELAAKIMVALQVPGTDVHQLVQVHRRYVMERMQQWTRIKERLANHDLGRALVVDGELARLDSVIRWLDAANGRLERAALLPGAVMPALPRSSPEGTSGAADDRIRISDADRERATARLRDHYAEGRLTREELDERVTAALNARIIGDLRRVMADLPGPAPDLQEA